MDTVKILVQKATLTNDAPIQEVEIPVLHSKGYYAVTRMIDCLDGQDVKYPYEQYTVTYQPTGRRCPVWFTNQKQATKFCNWIAANFPTGDVVEIKLRESQVLYKVAEFGGSF